ncbi:MAG TPA: protein phosphatase 2C domain-containing protein [Bryobacteraceae bacterium]|nr:protein phosphatase 2C domain-containing protein [Bryobacteraceae bacterium]
MMPVAPRYLVAASSDQGVVRGNNEDRVYADEARGFFLVVDGMGGHEAGEHAADIALERIRARLERQTGGIEQRIREAITLANNAILKAAEDEPNWKGMACVLTLAVIENGDAVIGHVGDSRLYRIKRGVIDKITHDHSPVGELEDNGAISETEAMQHPRRNEVFRDVGSAERTPDDDDFIEIRRIPFEPDSALLLCSDGLSDAISSRSILRIVEQNAGDRWTAVRNLIDAANEVGKDNVSAILVEGERFAASYAPSKPTLVTSTTHPKLSVVPTPQRVPWYRSAPAWFLYGVLAGGLVLWGVDELKPEAPDAPLPPQILAVAPPQTISDALQKARPGDTVVVTPGTYIEAVHLRDGIDLIAQTPHEAIIDGSVTASGIQKVRFEGFQVRAHDIGVAIKDSDVTLMRDEISGARTAAVLIEGASHGSLVACRIHDNAGAGIDVKGTAAPLIETNLIFANKPGIQIELAAQPRITGNTLLNNGPEPIWLPHPDPSLVPQNYFPDRRPKLRITQ